MLQSLTKLLYPFLCRSSWQPCPARESLTSPITLRSTHPGIGLSGTWKETCWSPQISSRNYITETSERRRFPVYGKLPRLHARPRSLHPRHLRLEPCGLLVVEAAQVKR